METKTSAQVKADRKKLERKLAKLIQKYCPDGYDYMACLLFKEGVGFLNSNVQRSYFDSTRMLYLLLKWCRGQSAALYEITKEPLYDTLVNDIDFQMGNIKHYLAAIKNQKEKK